MTAKKRPAFDDFSFGRLVATALAAGVGVLVVAVPIIMVIARDHPTAALVVAFVAVLLMVAVIGYVSRRMLRGVQDEIDRRKEEIARKHDEEAGH
ncbi:hypothetical protein [Gordonia zhaorongruii]|uniref:hypothetical protein n=1 Tax=Gordonia zhaorongruii TaxID=2597659 RepID=UPI00104A6134|nr:hypothetical protein [Gordonia zhaorongruii]